MSENKKRRKRKEKSQASSKKEKSSDQLNIPKKVTVELTPQMYQRLRDAQLRKIPPTARFYVKQYFNYLTELSPEEIIDAIETGLTLKNYYDKLGIDPRRFAIATARGFLKSSPRSKAQLKEAVSLDLVLTTLKYENPAVYTIIKKYGKKARDHLKQDINDALKILGVD